MPSPCWSLAQPSPCTSLFFLISLAGTPPAVAIAPATTLGYVGVLSGPALIGFVAHASSLSVAFVAVAGLLGLVGLSARIVR